MPVEVTGDATFRVIGPSIATDGNYAIRLADGEASNQLAIGGVATFIVEPPPAGGALPAAPPQGIDVGVTPTGVAASATFNAGSLRFNAPGGTVRIKVATRNGEVVNASPEFDDCVRIATATGRPVKLVQAEALRAWVK